MHHWTDENLARIKAMVNQDHAEAAKIATEFGTSARNMQNVICKNGLMSQAEFNLRQAAKHRSRIAARTAHAEELIRRNGNTPEMAYCLGATLGDGCIAKTNRGGLFICLMVRDESFAKEFFRAANVISGGYATFTMKHRSTVSVIANRVVKSEGTYFFVRICMTALCRWMKRANEEGFVLTQNPEFIGAFLRGVFDSDGCVPRREKNPRRWAVELVNGSESETELLKRCLERLGIRFSVYLDARKASSLHRMVIRSHESILKFSDSVGFTTSHRKERLQRIVETLRGGVE